ncbi:DNA polymerase IV [Occultella kanbiaonis]|uniref:DNA polymerase IV n=1 Tax=Occultella kanbiaonis TaxID=2675754 RepID=UPI0012B91435|nr:DNA polymerase IV [Occultella kanbiaonis]
MSAEPGPSTPGTTVHRVLHVDLDQFIAAVEVLRRPELAGRPVIVGGRGDPTERAVVSTASYEAREFGARSGMPLRIAARKVPDAVILPVDHDAYNEASEQVMATLRGLGVVVEVLGWDEAFLGAPATDPGMFADPEAFAARVRAAVLDATELHCSVGVGDNKVRAKIATDFGKPRGTFVLTAANWFEVMGDRDTIALWGVGSKVSKRLLGHGIRTVRELAAADEDVLVAEFGPRMGRWYHDLGRGEGPTEVDDSPWIARGHSRESTYQRNLTTPAEVADAVAVLAEQAFADTDAEGRAVMRVTLKVRYAPFFTFTRARKLPAPTRDRAEVVAAALALTADLDPEREVRLLGVRAEMVMPDGGDPAERTPVRGRL